MSSHAFISTMGVDVTVDALRLADSRMSASKVSLEFIEGTTLTFTLNDKALRKIVEGLDAYLKTRGQ